MRTKSITALATSFLAATTAPTLAGPIGDPELFDLYGQMYVGMLRPDDSDDLDYFGVDIFGRWQPNSSLGIGFSAEAFGVFTSGDDLIDRYTLYGFYEFAPGQEVRVGLLPSAIGLIQSDNLTAYPEPVELDFVTFLSSSVVDFLRYDDEEEFYAIGYAGDYGALQAEVSVHFNGDGDGSALAGAVRYNGDLSVGALYDYWVGGGAEFVQSETSDDSLRYFASAGIGSDYLDLEASLVVGDELFGTDQLTSIAANAEVDFEVFGVGSFLDDLAFAFNVTFADAGGNDLTVVGAALEYHNDNGLGVNASAGRASTSGGSETDWVALEAFLTF